MLPFLAEVKRTFNGEIYINVYKLNFTSNIAKLKGYIVSIFEVGNKILDITA